MKLTDFQKTKRGMLALFFDGDFAFSMPPDTFVQTGLTVGDEVDGEQLEELAYLAQEKKAREKAVDLLSYKPYTAKELRFRLLQKFDNEQAVESAVARMRELGYINDTEYARRYAEKLSSQKGFGVRRIRQELMRKGIDSACADEAIGELVLDEDQVLASIREVIAKKYPQADEDEKVRRRAYAALARRGFSFQDIRRAMEEDADDL